MSRLRLGLEGLGADRRVRLRRRPGSIERCHGAGIAATPFESRRRGPVPAPRWRRCPDGRRDRVGIAAPGRRANGSGTRFSDPAEAGSLSDGSCGAGRSGESPPTVRAAGGSADSGASREARTVIVTPSAVEPASTPPPPSEAGAGSGERSDGVRLSRRLPRSRQPSGRVAPDPPDAARAVGGGHLRGRRRSVLDRGQGQRTEARPERHRPGHRRRRPRRPHPLVARHRRRRRHRRAVHRPAPVLGLPRVAHGRDPAARRDLRPDPAPALRLPRPGAGRRPHEPGQHRPAADPGLRGADPAHHLQLRHRRRGHRHPLHHRLEAGAPVAGLAPAAQLPGQALLDPPPPLRDGHPAGVGRAGLGGGGDRQRRAGGQGVRRPGRAGHAGCGPRPTTSTRPRWGRPGSGPGSCPAWSCSPTSG